MYYRCLPQAQTLSKKSSRAIETRDGELWQVPVFSRSSYTGTTCIFQSSALWTISQFSIYISHEIQVRRAGRMMMQARGPFCFNDNSPVLNYFPTFLALRTICGPMESWIQGWK